MHVVRSLLVKMRSWIDGRGGGGPFPNADALPDMTEEQVVDRYHQHTKNCPSCSVVRTPSLNLYAAGWRTQLELKGLAPHPGSALGQFVTVLTSPA